MLTSVLVEHILKLRYDKTKNTTKIQKGTKYMKKLNMQGISHLLIPIVVVVAVAAIGTFMLVSSHAASKQNVIVNWGDADVKSVKSDAGKVHTISDLEVVIGCQQASACASVDDVTVNGQRMKFKNCGSSGRVCEYTLRVNGNKNNKVYPVKLYVNGKVNTSDRVRFN